MKKILFLVVLLFIKQINAQVCFTPYGNFNTIGSPEHLITADFNKDGKADLAVSGGSNVSILSGAGTGSFTPTANYAVGNGAYFVCTADFNGDANLDLATSNVSANNVSVLLGSGTGTFSAAVNFGVAGTSPYSVCSADFNGDGKADLATCNSGSNNVSILLGDGLGSFSTASTFTTGNSPYGICSGDFNNDGKTDLATANNTGANVSVLLGNGSGSFGAAANFSNGGGNTRSIISQDFNGDGFTDLYVANSGSNNVTLFSGNGSGSFTPGPNIPTGATFPRSIASADFDGNGVPDITTADYGSVSSPPYYVTVLMNGSGGPTIGLGGSSNGPHGVCTADFNGDGRADIATANEASNNVTILLNNLPAITISGATSLCSAGNINTILTASGATTYTWSANAGSVTTVSVSLTPSVTTTYTVSGNNSGCGVTPTRTVTVTVNTPPALTVSVSANPICFGASSTLSASGASTYTWSGGIANGVAFTPTTTTNYTVTGTSSAGCSVTASTTITVNPLPTLTVSATASTVCFGTQVTLTASGANTYTWTGGITNGLAFTPSTSVTYSVSATDVNGCTGSATKAITVNPLPTVLANSTATVICLGSPVTLTGSGTSTSYTWTGGVTNGVAFPAVNQTYTVTGTDGNNCTNTATVSISAPPLPNPFICMLTADSLAINNIIYWDKTFYTTADSFIVYRYDAFSTTYFKIGTVSKDSGHFTDTKRNIGGPNGGDPAYGSWQYKLAVKDTCGNISAKSPYHQSVFVQENFQNFNWNAYVIEAGQANPVTGYSLQKKSNWHK